MPRPAFALIRRHGVFALIGMLVSVPLPAVAADLAVGPGERYSRIEDALAKGDYRLTTPDRAIVGIGLPVEKPLVKLQEWLPQYKPSLQVIQRSDSTRPAIGACEYAASPAAPG